MGTLRWRLLMSILALWLSAECVAQPPAERRPRGRRAPDKLSEGDLSIDFTLRTVDGKKKVRLSGFREQKPVALIFGSYT